MRRRTRRSGGRQRGLGRLACLIGLLGSTPTPLLSQVPPSARSQNALAGSRVFGAKGCVRCHAVHGLGGTVGPDLGRIPGLRSYYDFGAAMWNHLPRMAARMRELNIPRPDLAPWEAADLVAFLFWHNYFTPPGDTARGRLLFAAKGCIVCHQVRGSGGVVGPNLDFLHHYGSPIQIATGLWNHASRMTEVMRSRGITRPTLAGSELNDIIAFLRGDQTDLPSEPTYVLPGDVERGRRNFIEQGCIRCHSVDGVGGKVGPDLADRARSNVLDFAAAMWNKAPKMIEAMTRLGIWVPELTATSMADLVAYLYSVAYFGEAGQVARGRQLLRTRGCLGCHELNRTGGPTASDLATTKILDPPAGVIAALWNHVTIASSVQGAADWPTMEARDIADLSAYFGSLGGKP